MLRQLHIEDYALIDRLDIEFRPGLNLLTGETGSGKSIVVDAVGLLLGEKASSDLIRSGAERARIVGIFSPEPPARPSSGKAGGSSRKANPVSRPAGSQGRWAQILKLLEESGVELAVGEELILQRDILPGGRSRIFVNN